METARWAARTTAIMKDTPMRRSWIVLILLMAGCQNVRGPLQPQPASRIDDPRYTITEQEARARDRFAAPYDMGNTAPSLQTPVPGVPPR